MVCVIKVHPFSSEQLLHIAGQGWKGLDLEGAGLKTGWARMRFGWIREKRGLVSDGAGVMTEVEK